MSAVVQVPRSRLSKTRFSTGGWLGGTASYPSDSGILALQGVPGLGFALTQSYSAFSPVAAEAAFDAIRQFSSRIDALNYVRDRHIAADDEYWNRGQIALLGSSLAAAYTGEG